jgi:hypothetical protein
MNALGFPEAANLDELRVPMMKSGRKSCISFACRSACPPDKGMTVQPSLSAP